VGKGPVPWAPSLPWERGRFSGLRLSTVGALPVPGSHLSAVWAWPFFRPRLSAVGAWPVPWAPSVGRGGVAGPLGPICLPWGSGRSPGPRLSAVGGCPVPWAPSVCRGGVAGPLGAVCPLWGRGYSSRSVWVSCGCGRTPGLCMAAVGAWPVPWVLSGCRGAWLVFWGPSRRRGGVAGLLGPVWPPWGRGRSLRRRLFAVKAWPVPWVPIGCRGGVADPLGPVCPPSGRDRSPGHRLDVVGAWLIPWAPSGRCGDVAGLLGFVWSRVSMAGFLCPVWVPWGRGRSPGPLLTAVGVWLVPWDLSDRGGGVAGFLCPVSPPWGRGWYPVSRLVPWGCCRFPGHRLPAVGASPAHWAPFGCSWGVASPLDLCCRRGLAGFLGPVWPLLGCGRFFWPHLVA